MAPGDGEALGPALQELLDRAVDQDPPVRNGVLRVDVPGLLSWQGASGVADPERGLPMRPEHQFQAASITKMITATTLMTLVEDGRVQLDAGISRCLPTSITTGLHEYGGRSFGPEITTRQLLAHTSGVADFFGDGEPLPGGALPFVAEMLKQPDKLWDPLEIIAWTKAHLRPHFPPGHGWHYADTGFVLAGLIIETVTGDKLHDVMRKRLFEPLGMHHTHMLFQEPARPGPAGAEPSRAYAGELDYGGHRSVSADWASGGLVTTADDLSRFIGAFAEGRILRDPASKQAMLSWTPTGERGVQYGLGVRRFVLDQLGMPGFGELWGHTGFLKSFMLYWPERQARICGTLNQSAASGVFSELRPVAALVPAVLRELQERRI